MQNPKTGDTISLGEFVAARDAAEAFDVASLFLSNETDNLNFPSVIYGKKHLIKGEMLLKDLWHRRPSRYMNVYRSLASDKWKAEITIGKKTQFLGIFDTELEAAEAADRSVRGSKTPKAVKLPQLNFRQDSDYFDEETWEDEAIPRDATSCFVGVTYHQPSDQFLARIGRKHIGLFDSEIDAAMAFDEISGAKGGVTNFKPVDQDAA